MFVRCTRTVVLDELNQAGRFCDELRDIFSLERIRPLHDGEERSLIGVMMIDDADTLSVMLGSPSLYIMPDWSALSCPNRSISGHHEPPMAPKPGLGGRNARFLICDFLPVTESTAAVVGLGLLGELRCRKIELFQQGIDLERFIVQGISWM